MKKVSEKELDRLKKRDGVKVIRRLGTGKKPEPEVRDETALSGAKKSVSPVPVSDELNSVMSQMTEILSRQANEPLQLVKEEMNGKVKKIHSLIKQAKKDLETSRTTASETISKQEQVNKDLSETISKQEQVNKDLEKRILKQPEPSRVKIINPVPENYFPKYDESEAGKFILPAKPKLRSKWMHVLHRDESTGYMNQIISTDQSGNQWVHDIIRSSKNLIAKILSKPHY